MIGRRTTDDRGRMLFRSIAALLSVVCLLSSVVCRATTMSGLPAGGPVSGTDTIAVCQKAIGCGTTDPLKRLPMSAVQGYVEPAFNPPTASSSR